MLEILDSLFPVDSDVQSPAVIGQVAAVHEACGIARLSHLGALEISGKDAVRFLHGQCTQDVKAKKPGEGGYAFLLDPRGRNLGDLRFVVRESGIWCVLDQDRLASTAAWLERFVIASDVRIRVLADQAGILVAGPRASEMLPAAADFVIISDRPAAEEWFQIWGTPDGLASLVKSLAARGGLPVSATALEIVRIEAGLPRFGVDLDENVLPGESGQGDRAVSYTKGCYSGQEVVAKQKYLGKPRKLLVGVLPDTMLSTPAPLVGPDGKELAGTLTSCVFSPTLLRPIGLAMLKAPLPAAGEALLGPEGVRVKVASLPFSRA